METLKSISVARLGWSMLLSWVFCVFYLEISPFEEMAGRPDAAAASVFGIAIDVVPVAFAVVTLLVLVLKEVPGKAVDTSRTWCVFAPVAAALATPFLLWHPSSATAAVGLYLVAGAVAGVSSGMMWVLWGIQFSQLGQDRVEATTLASAVLAALVVLAASAMSGWVAIAVVSGMPLISRLLYFMAQKERDVVVENREHEQGERTEEQSRTSPPGEGVGAICGNGSCRNPADALHAMGRSGWGIFAVCFFTCVLGGLPLFDNGFSPTRENMQIAICASLVFMGIVGVMSVAGPRRMSVSFVFRWMCPVLVCGFASVILFTGQVAGLLAFCISVAARFAFCTITQVYFARFAAAGLATPTQSYGIGWIFVHAGDLFGVVILAVLRQTQIATDMPIALAFIVALVAVAMYVLGDRAAFSSALGLGERQESAAQAENAQSGTLANEEGGRIAQLAAQFSLTPRETEVFNLLMRGRSVPYIRDALVVSRDTAATHVKHIYQKAGVHSRQELLDLLSAG